MVTVTSLWLPILVSAAFVFLVSSLIHMVLPYHRSNFKKVPSEDDVRDSLGKIGIPPGDYMIPHCSGPKEMNDPELMKKMNDGPVVCMTVMPSGPPAMARNLVLWFIYSIVIGIFAAYISGRALGPDAHYLQVFRFAGCTAFIGYCLAFWQDSIWYKRSWMTTVKMTFDGLVYALVTAGTFGWLWP